MSIEVHPQVSNNRHPVDGALVDANSMWPSKVYKYFHFILDFSFGLSLLIDSSQMPHCFNMKLHYKTFFSYNIQDENGRQKTWDKI
jgi:hypothetical protein